ncbi:sigma-70 family RNA polymerase sigma factor [Sinomonas sp. ASV322]|uniref:RNA polymerase sigma factor n=1 Tax=Sinomonas sp. ASV322 TaxID=3041920 RepID=UPI0027DB8163|nr:sigma-70 family RNA polymerase sigma factor [Sinomonas sp. ASV322]MDQ4500742.1 sigma-70 family RNA polymerase sigma factor [Sinomonas sp. ASV322]
MEPQQEVSAAATSTVPQDIGAVFLKHRDAMYGVAHAMLRTDRHHRAEDVISEVMVSILKNPPGSVRNWESFLVRAVQNKVRDLWRSSGYRHEQPVLAEGSPIEGDPLVGDHVEDDLALEVIEAIDRQQTVQKVREVMAELDAWDPQAAYVLWQCKGLERTSQQVADELEVSSSRVRQILSKALTRFRSLLEAKEVKL